MYKITWDKETGGVQLHSRIVEGTLGISPRPVFFEGTEKLKPTIKLKVDDGEIAVLPFIFCLF